MDPLSIISLIASVGSVADIVVRSISKLSHFRTKYRDAPFIINILLGQLCTIQTALDQLKVWSQTNAGVHPRYPELSKQLEDALVCFAPIMTHLYDQLNIHDQEESSQIARKRRISFVWREKDLNEYFQMLNAQVGALTLLLQALQCTTWKDQRDLLSEPDSKYILRSARDCSSSMIVLRADDASSNRASSVIDNEDAISQCFEFDDDLLQSRVYTLTYRSHLKKVATRAISQGPKPQVTRSSSIASIVAGTKLTSILAELPPNGTLTPPVNPIVPLTELEDNGWSLVELPATGKIATSSTINVPKPTIPTGLFTSTTLQRATKSAIPKHPPNIHKPRYWYEGIRIKANEGGYNEEYALYLYRFAKFPILFRGKIDIQSERAVIWHSFVWAASQDYMSELSGHTFSDVLGWLVNDRLKYGRVVALVPEWRFAARDQVLELALVVTGGPSKNNMVDVRVSFSPSEGRERTKGAPPVLGRFDVSIHRSTLWPEYSP